MKKFILIVLLVGIVGVAGVSVWGSLRAKEAYRTLILACAESPDVRVLETGYEQGWLQSTAHASVEIRGPLGEFFQQWMMGLGLEEVRGRLGIRIQQTIEHGYYPLMEWLTVGPEGLPIVGRVETHLELDKETQSELAAVMGRLPPVSISTLIRALGIAESSVIVPARSFEPRVAGDEGGAWVGRWEGLHGELVYATDFDHFAASFHSAGFQVRSADSSFVVRDLEWTADMARDESGLLVGDMKNSVGAFRLSSREEGATGLEVDRWTMTQSNVVEAGSFGTALGVRVQAIRLGERAFGPGEVEFQLRNLDARSLARLQSQSVGGLAPPGSQDVTQAAVDEGAENPLFDLASRSPQLEIRTLRLATPSGNLEAKLRIDLDGSQPDFLRNFFTLLLVLRVHGEFECPAEILEALYQEREEEFLELRREGWVLLDGERYRSRLELEGGELRVNGIPRALDGRPGQSVTPESLPQISATD